MSAQKPAPRPLLICHNCQTNMEPCEHVAVNIKYTDTDAVEGLIHTCEKCYFDECADLVESTHEALKFERTTKKNYHSKRLRMEHSAKKIQYCWFNYKYPMDEDWYSTEEESEETDEDYSNNWEDPYREWPTEEWEEEPDLSGGEQW